jgi:hypothetical protein
MTDDLKIARLGVVAGCVALAVPPKNSVRRDIIEVVP